MDLNGVHLLVQRLAASGELPSFLTGVVAALILGGILFRLVALPWFLPELKRLRERVDQRELELENSREREQLGRREHEAQQAELGQSRQRCVEAEGKLAEQKREIQLRRRDVEAERRKQNEEVQGLQKRLLDQEEQRKGLEEALRRREAELTEERREAKEVEARVRWLESDTREAQGRLEAEKAARQAAESARDELSRQQSRLLNADVRVWERAAEAAPAFVPLGERGVPIVSVMNLKGGVGKTNITANLAVALSRMRRGDGEGTHRVLVVDLDFQGSLTDLCLSYEQREVVRQEKRLVRRLLVGQADGSNGVDLLPKCVSRVRAVREGRMDLVAADELLEGLENRLMLRWATGQIGDDVRYRLRGVLHGAAAARNYDVILLDCPPRLTTGCINALTASDWVLIPVLLDEVSARAVPRMLRWIQKLRPEVCPELELLGVVANRVNMRLGKPIKREAEVWDRLQEACRRYWEGPVKHFDAMIGEHADIPYAGGVRLAALDSKHESRYLDLARAVLAEVYSHAGG